MAITRKEHSIAKRSAVVTWRRAGKSLSEIAQLEDLARSTVQSILDRFKKNSESLANKKRSGRPPKISARGERLLVRAATSDTRLPIIALGTPSKTAGKQINRPTIRKILKKTQINRRKARKKPFITKAQKRSR
jgi:transposase